MTPNLKAFGEIMALTPVIFAGLHQNQYFTFSFLKARFAVYIFTQSFPGLEIMSLRIMRLRAFTEWEYTAFPPAAWQQNST